jgi:3-(3-hydroxy-phenyl)propionate hydroxylase
MSEHAVVVAGAGPTGLMLAGELALAGIDVVIVERRATQDLDGSRAGGLFPRSIEVLDQRGIAERFLSAGQVHPALSFSLIPLNVSDFPTRHNYVLALWQSHFERILAGWIEELGVPILRSREVTGFAQNEHGVDVQTSAGALHCEYLVGCDGGRSVIRKTAGIDFAGLDPTTSWMIAEVEMDEEPEFGMRRDRFGQHALNRREPGEPIRVLITERRLESGDNPTIDELRAALVGVYGTDYGLRGATWISRFADMTREATA